MQLESAGELQWICFGSILAVLVHPASNICNAYLGLSQDDCPARTISSWLEPNHPGCVDDVGSSDEECSQDDLKPLVALSVWIPALYGLNRIPSDCIGVHRMM